MPLTINKFLVSLCKEGPKIPAPTRNKLNHKVQDEIRIFIDYASLSPFTKSIDLVTKP